VSTGSISVQSIHSYEQLWALAREWQALEVAAATQVPFQTWEWSTSWWRHLHEDSSGVRDSMRVCVIRAPSGELIGVAPLMLTERPSRGPLRLRVLQFFGADPNITALRAILCHPDLARACYGAVRAHLASSYSDWDWIAWEGYAADSAIDMADPLLDLQSSSAFVLPLARTWPEMKQGLKRNIKESLRHCYNSLKRDGLSCTLDVCVDPTDIAQGLPDFFRLHAARAQLQETLNHADVFETEQSQAFLTDVTTRLAERGVAKLFQLRINGRVVAARIGFELGETLYLYYSGWEPAYGQYGVMTTLTSEIIQFAIQRGLGAVHLSTGRDVSKTRWGAHELTYLAGAQLSPRLTSRAFYTAYQSVLRPAVMRQIRALVPAHFVRKSHDPRRTRPGPGAQRPSILNVLP
jgi:CelD/BcsL family acetyltransferase involved in cellulose biosynthesis